MTATGSTASGEGAIAVVGMAAHVTGASSVSELWRMVRENREGITMLSDEALLAAGVARSTLHDPAFVKAAGILDRLADFDAEFFGLSPQEAAVMDPQHRHFLECCWEAMEDAFHPPDGFGGAIGVFAGCGQNAYYVRNVLRNASVVENVGEFLLRHTGNDKDFLATRASYIFDLRGPSISVQTACSTSLVAIHQACQSLLSGECDMALAGGATIEIPHGVGYHYREGEVLSPTGHCHPFDHRGQGTIFGSGAGIVALRRLDDAMADGDRIYAIVRGSAVNNDGAGKVGYLAPSVDGQAAAVTEAIAVADIDPSTIGFLECHGTGTAVGDPIEITAITQAYRAFTSASASCAIGSIKANIGHLDTAAGVVGFIKAALALHHELIPPLTNFERANPEIDFDRTPFHVPTEARAWPRGSSPRRAAVNSLGVGGTNAHAVLEEAPSPSPSPAPLPPDRAASPAPATLVLRGKSARALDDLGRDLADRLEQLPDAALPCVAHTLLHGRAAFPHRRVVSAHDRTGAIAALRSSSSACTADDHVVSRGGSLVFLFPGGGAAYPAMGRGLRASDPLVDDLIDEGLAFLEPEVASAVAAVLDGGDFDPGDIERPSIQLPALFLIEHALARTLIARGFAPAAMLGHSMGENTAACVAGVMSYGDATRLVALRGLLLDRVPESAMLSVLAGEHDIAPRINGGLDLACVNGPSTCVVSGTVDAIERLARELEADEIDHRRVPIRIAAHSQLLDPILPDFRLFLESIALRPPTIPVISNRTGTWLTDQEACAPEYWTGQLRHTVRFEQGVGTLLGEERTFVEVGPGRTLGTLARLHPIASGTATIPTLRHAEEDVPDDLFLATALGRLRERGHGESAPRAALPLVDLPTYAFQRDRFWIDATPDPIAGDVSLEVERDDDPERWLWVPTWNEAPAIDTGSDVAAHRWLVFVDDTGLGAGLAAALRARGAEVLEVRTGYAYAQNSATSFTLSPRFGADGYAALVRDVMATGPFPDRIVHAWTVTGDEEPHFASDFAQRNKDYGLASLVLLVQAMLDADAPPAGQMIVLSNGAIAVNDEAPAHPEKALITGPVLVLPHELESLHARLVDIDLPSGTTRHERRERARRLPAMAESLALECAQAEFSGVFAYREGRRLQRGERRAPAPDPVSVNGSGHHVITGGLGGVGLALAEHLVRSAGDDGTAPKLVLIGRTPLPPRDDWPRWRQAQDETGARVRAVESLESRGAEVEVVAADVCDPTALASALDGARERFGPITGVFHAAGLTDDALLAQKSLVEIDRVLAPKLFGARALLDALESREPEFLVLFSSTSTIVAPPGQVDYIAANAFLDALAAHCRHRVPYRVVSIDWGVWSEVGMAARAIRHADPSTRAIAAAPAHPLLDRAENDARGTLVCSSDLDGDHWILDEHRTRAGTAVLPGTGYADLVAGGAGMLGAPLPFTIEDLLFLRPMVVPGGRRSVAVETRLTPVAGGATVSVRSRATADDGQDGWLTHAQCRLEFGGSEPASAGTESLAEIRARLATGTSRITPDGAPPPQSTRLAFGPRWDVIRERLDHERETLARLELSERSRREDDGHVLHPALLDAATGLAVDRDPRDAEGTLWVPLSYDRLTVHAPLPATAWTWVRRREEQIGRELTVDVTVFDESGRTVLDIAGFTMHAVPAAHALAAGRPAAHELDRRDRPVAPTSAAIALRSDVANGLTPAAAFDMMGRVLAAPDGRAHAIISSMPLPALRARAERLRPRADESAGQFARPALANAMVEPRTPTERTLAGFWSEQLGVEQVGVTDDFFDLGGHSLIAVRLFSKIRRTFGVDLPISTLFNAPTIEACAALVDADRDDDRDPDKAGSDARRFRHLVPMSPGGAAGTPFFIVAGMYGNVLNLRALAAELDVDRPIYGLQALGLYGDHDPHETFEDMARDYLAEVRQIQPHGPYLLGGFSGGGIAAYEMARQLKIDGEETAALIMLDTPIPRIGELGSMDKLAIHWQLLRARGLLHIARTLRDRTAWKRRQEQLADPASYSREDLAASEQIRRAFYRAVDRYEVRPHDGLAVVLRPPLRAAFTLPGGRLANSARSILKPDNGWQPYVDRLEIEEVPGDHDSMVLEPHVRVLAARIRRRLAQADLPPGGPQS